MNVLVTGGAGYIGSHTARRLLQQGHRVLVLDNLSSGHQATLDVLAGEGGSRFEAVIGNVGDAAVLDPLFKTFQPSTVVHFAACLDVAESMVRPLRYYSNNLASTVTLLSAMEQSDCRGLIFSSSCSTYGQPDRVPVDEDTPQRPLSPYGRSKWMVEQVLRDCATAWGLGSVSLRYFNVAGASADGRLGEIHEPEVHLVPRVLMAIAGHLPHLDICGTDYPTPDGTCIRDYLHVDDIARAHVLMLDRVPAGCARAYNLGTGHGYSVRDIIQAAERVTRQMCPVREVARRPGDPARLVATAARISTEQGWQAGYQSIDDIIATAWAFMQGQPVPAPGRPLS